MQFTEKEIELAKQLKEAGLEWKPAVGDHYIYDLKYNRDSIVTLIDFDRGDKGWIYVKSLLDGLRNINLCCWLPLWHQCREWLQKNGWKLGDFIDWNGKVDVQLINEERIFAYGFTADTDLEAMYKALLAGLGC